MKINPKLLEILVCPMCKSGVELLNSKIKCLNCGEEFVIEEGIPIMLPRRLSQDLKLTIDKWNEWYRKISFQDIAKTKLDWELEYLYDTLEYLVKFWKVEKRNAYLEIGCGQAFLGLEMAKRGLRVFGLDISIEALKIAKQIYEKEGREGLFVCGDLLNAPLEENKFEFIYGGGVIEHFRETEKAIRELYRILGKNGSAFNTVPYLSLSSLTYRQLWGNIPDLPVLSQLAEMIHIKMLKKRYMQFGYEKSFTMRKLANMFKAAGFKNLDMGLFQCYLPVTFVKSERLKNLIRWLARCRPFWPMVYISAKK